MGHFFLSHLLPYDPEIKKQSRLENGLNEILLLLVAAEESIKSFQRGELDKFDPLVGENSCQIRAVKIALIASKKTFDAKRLLSEIAYSKKNIIELLKSVDHLSVQEKSLKCCIESHDIDIFMSKDAIFLIKCYILSKVKVVGGKHRVIKFWKNEKTLSKKVREFNHVSSSFAVSFIRRLREQLSKSSAGFVQELSKCPLLADEKIEEILNDFSISYKGLHCMPFYWMTKVIMHRAFTSKIPIIMLAEQVAQDLEYKVLEKTTLVFYPAESGYKVVSRDFLDIDQPIMVFNAVSCRDSCDFSDKETWERELTEYDLVDLVLACNAAHRQYPDPSKEYLVREFQDEDYTYHLEKSKEWGCYLENPSRFFLTHVRCDYMRNV